MLEGCPGPSKPLSLGLLSSQALLLPQALLFLLLLARSLNRLLTLKLELGDQTLGVFDQQLALFCAQQAPGSTPIARLGLTRKADEETIETILAVDAKRAVVAHNVDPLVDTPAAAWRLAHHSIVFIDFDNGQQFCAHD
ncbi:hypothetical protein ACUXPM_005447 [Ralstonia sp. 151470066-2]|jgi:hypothetical protein|uniref:Uncharacterized protein n=2 Tax=Pseudomonadota TaxID=1224 RepID=A0AAD2BSW4_9RALS|nr:hypothetical protein TK49_23455 [Ralstonia mannitolilytica]MBA9871461.1 hypothetical protein [Ralstonia insidiosa]MBB0026577.1 hypothetical protein [Ralstonia pickettii]MDH6644529.1 hypothetical protein [Ralstonia sp. GP73]CAJ0806528.1 hypothetical protein R77560_04436 [Ralstonia sp. LMG 18095]